MKRASLQEMIECANVICRELAEEEARKRAEELALKAAREAEEAKRIAEEKKAREAAEARRIAQNAREAERRERRIAVERSENAAECKKKDLVKRTLGLVSELRKCSARQRRSVAIDLAMTRTSYAVEELKCMVEGRHRAWFKWYNFGDQLIGIEALGETGRQDALDYLKRFQIIKYKEKGDTEFWGCPNARGRLRQHLSFGIAAVGVASANVQAYAQSEIGGHRIIKDAIEKLEDSCRKRKDWFGVYSQPSLPDDSYRPWWAVFSRRVGWKDAAALAMAGMLAYIGVVAYDLASVNKDIKKRRESLEALKPLVEEFEKRSRERVMVPIPPSPGVVVPPSPGVIIPPAAGKETHSDLEKKVSEYASMEKSMQMLADIEKKHKYLIETERQSVLNVETHLSTLAETGIIKGWSKGSDYWEGPPDELEDAKDEYVVEGHDGKSVCLKLRRDAFARKSNMLKDSGLDAVKLLMLSQTDLEREIDAQLTLKGVLAKPGASKEETELLLKEANQALADQKIIDKNAEDFESKYSSEIYHLIRQKMNEFEKELILKLKNTGGKVILKDAEQQLATVFKGFLDNLVKKGYIRYLEQPTPHFLRNYHEYFLDTDKFALESIRWYLFDIRYDRFNGIPLDLSNLSEELECNGIEIDPVIGPEPRDPPLLGRTVLRKVNPEKARLVESYLDQLVKDKRIREWAENAAFRKLFTSDAAYVDYVATSSDGNLLCLIFEEISDIERQKKLEELGLTAIKVGKQDTMQSLQDAVEAGLSRINSLNNARKAELNGYGRIPTQFGMSRVKRNEAEAYVALKKRYRQASCDVSDEHIYMLFLRDNALEQIPDELYQFSQMVFLDLEGNHLKSLKEIINFLNVRSIDLSRNNITSLDDFDKLPRSVRQLNLIGNPIDWNSPTNLEILKKLERTVSVFKVEGDDERDFQDSMSATEHYYGGNGLYNSDKFDEAVSAYNKSIELNPRSPHAHKALGQALYRLKRFDEAVDSYKRAIELQPDSADTHLLLGITLTEQGKRDEAMRHFKISADLGDGGAALRLEKLRKEAAKPSDVPSAAPEPAGIPVVSYHGLEFELFDKDKRPIKDSYDKSLERLRKAGFERHARPKEAFGLVIDWLEGKLTGDAKNLFENSLKTTGEWLSAALERKGNTLILYLDPEGLVFKDDHYEKDNFRFAEKKEFKIEKKEFEIEGHKFDRYAPPEALSDELVRELYGRSFKDLPKDMREATAMVVIPVDNEIWPIGRGNFTMYGVGGYDYYNRESRGVRSAKPNIEQKGANVPSLEKRVDGSTEPAAEQPKKPESNHIPPGMSPPQLSPPNAGDAKAPERQYEAKIMVLDDSSKTDKYKAVFEKILKYKPTIVVNKDLTEMISLESRQLSEIPPELKQYQARNVFLWGNEIRSITNLDGARFDYLGLDRNKIEDTGGIKNIGAVKTINLSYNKIKQLRGFESLKGVEILLVYGNPLDYNDANTRKTLEDLRQKGVNVVDKEPVPK